MSAPPDYIGPAAVAALLGVRPSAVSNYAVRGSWPPGFPDPVAHREHAGRRAGLWRRTDVERYVREHADDVARRRRYAGTGMRSRAYAYARETLTELRAERDADIRARRAAGETLAAIGERHGITRERVRQIVAAGP